MLTISLYYHCIYIGCLSYVLGSLYSKVNKGLLWIYWCFVTIFYIRQYLKPQLYGYEPLPFNSSTFSSISFLIVFPHSLATVSFHIIAGGSGEGRPCLRYYLNYTYTGVSMADMCKFPTFWKCTWRNNIFVFSNHCPFSCFTAKNSEHSLLQA